MKNLFARLFAPKHEIIREVVIANLHKLPERVSVAFKKEGDLLIGKIRLNGDEDPMYIQAENPVEFTKMLNEAIYVTFDFKKEYIEFFHSRGDRYKPTPEAKRALDELYGKSTNQMDSNFQQDVGFVKNDAPLSVPAVA